MRETDAQRLQRMIEYETPLWEAGLQVAGIDEVGRGPLAGPVVTACVIVPREALVPGVNDSKKVAEKKRERLYGELIAAATYARTGWRSPQDIDRLNILAATKEAMEEAAAGAVGAHFLIDAVTGLALPGESTSIIHGDALSFMIAAASIVAKVTRDRYMIELDEKYPEYGFARNKGYGTAEHIAALKKYGPCPEHRRSFIQGILGSEM
ncbi:MAG: ribonuclease HII [Clostridia bacterium]|nr:ribonuclease HII [Clostridia bacterium]